MFCVELEVDVQPDRPGLLPPAAEAGETGLLPNTRAESAHYQVSGHPPLILSPVGHLLQPHGFTPFDPALAFQMLLLLLDVLPSAEVAKRTVFAKAAAVSLEWEVHAWLASAFLVALPPNFW